MTLEETIAHHHWAAENCVGEVRNEHSQMVGWLEELERLKDENTKLRKLVRDAWGNGHPDKSCEDCEIMDECHAEIEEAYKEGNGRWNTRCLFERQIEQRMREFGIEGDE